MQEEFDDQKQIKVIINDTTFICQRVPAIQSSSTLEKFFLSNPTATVFEISIPGLNIEENHNIIMSAFNNTNIFLKCHEIGINFTNIGILKTLSQELDMKTLSDYVEKFYNLKKLFHNFKMIERGFINCDPKNEENSTLIILSHFQEMDEKQFFNVVYRVLLSSFTNNNAFIIKILKKCEESNFGILERFISFILDSFIIMLKDRRYKDSNMVALFIHYLLDQEILSLNKLIFHPRFHFIPMRLPTIFVDYVQSDSIYNCNIDIIDYEIHKTCCNLCREIDTVFEIIQNDNIDAFQQFLYESKLNINHLYCKSMYERHFLLNSYSVGSYQKKFTLIDYAASYGSIKCFKYLLNNHAEYKTKSLGQYAILGNNKEIIHICDQNGCTFHNTIPITIQYHYHSLTKWLIDNNKDQIPKNLMQLCFECYNYVIIKYLLQKEMNINELVANSSKYDNYNLLQYIMKALNN
ncbi:hypothetical protein TRFO_12216 [Tritrichomonas foetus]|uniref:DUF3447 domain-containing protein n=1 Tax=Tritrichomonas foetus TaxID=1144522 RepID=A0A1J4J280_9EUKA|nr:hypothetical protein TRFO_12216 [Tritrichomonas foetus]|eukprot:OHS92857.1 hypothetical protein TRFO_12216 [Tritrichomonas foetus]